MNGQNGRRGRRYWKPWVERQMRAVSEIKLYKTTRLFKDSLGDEERQLLVPHRVTICETQ